jgi:hypothetical protein
MWHAWETRGKFIGFWWESQVRDHLEDRGVDGRMGSEWILGRLAWGSVKWIQLAQDRDRWLAVVDGDEPSGSSATELVFVDRYVVGHSGR